MKQDASGFMTYVSLSGMIQTRHQLFSAFDQQKGKWRAMEAFIIQSKRNETVFAFITILYESQAKFRREFVDVERIELLHAEVYRATSDVLKHGHRDEKKEIIIRNASLTQLERHLF
jgi:hypothetical protein